MLLRELGRGAGRDGPPESSPGVPGGAGAAGSAVRSLGAVRPARVVRTREPDGSGGGAVPALPPPPLCPEFFFLDSLTFFRSRVRFAAEKEGLAYIRCNIFLDNEQEQTTILQQLKKAQALAQKKESCICCKSRRGVF